MKCIGQVGTLGSGSSQLGSEVTNRSVKMGDLVGEMMICLFKLSTSGLAIMEGNVSGIEFYSAGVKLGRKIGNCGIEVGILVSEMGVGGFQLGTSGLAGRELS